MSHLKRFLLYRDNHPDFEDVIIGGFVGIPCVVLNGGQHVYSDLDKTELDEIAKKMEENI